MSAFGPAPRPVAWGFTVGSTLYLFEALGALRGQEQLDRRDFRGVLAPKQRVGGPAMWLRIGWAGRTDPTHWTMRVGRLS